MIDYLVTEDAVLLAEDAGFVIRDLGLLAGALARPQATAFGRDAYPEFPAKIAALMDAINRSHPLLDDNQRLSWICAVVFAARNGVVLSAPQREIDAVIRAVADGALPLAELTQWVAAHAD